jgi:hypothetical protein
MALHVYVFLFVFFLLWLARLGRLCWLPLHPSHFKAGAVRTTVHRLLKPRTPLDCPSCRLTCTPWPSVRPAPALVRPWSEVKSRRGAPKRIDTHGFACPNYQCSYFGNTDAHIHASFWRWQARPGRADPDLPRSCLPHHLQCARRHALVPIENALAADRRGADHALAEGLDPSAAERVFSYRQATITTWLSRADEHAHTLHERFFFHLPHLQLDELRTRLRSAKHVLWLAIDPLSKSIPVLHVGPRTQTSAHTVIHSVRQSLAPGCIPLFTSDGLNLYFYALTAHFGHWLQVGRRGRNVLRWQVAAGLIYGQVKKCYRRCKLVKVRHVMRLGTEDALKVALQGMGLSGRLNTAFTLRVNLTIRLG